VRNSVGFDWHPVTKELYFTDNGRDWLSEDLPEDELNRVTKTGQHFRLPLLPPGATSPIVSSAGAARAMEFEKPVALLGPTPPPSACAFTPAKMFPSQYQNAIFIARHGSWNRNQKNRRRRHRRETEQGRQRKIPRAVFSPAFCRTTNTAVGPSTCR